MDMDKDQILARLRDPFALKYVKWLPQDVNYDDGTAIALPYADVRAYYERLSEVFGVDGWSSDIQFTVTPYTKLIKGRKAYKNKPATEDRIISGNKLFVVATLHIKVWNAEHTSTGESDAADDNAATSAEAQAFKRACVPFGLGEYFYRVKSTNRYKYSYGKWVDTPHLPDWAIPPVTCESCAQPIRETVWKGSTYVASRIVETSQRKYEKDLCLECQRELAEKAKQAAGSRLDQSPAPLTPARP